MKKQDYNERAASALRRLSRAAAVALVVSPGLLYGQATPSKLPQALIERPPSIATTKHTATIAGQTIDYTATVEEHILTGADGIPNAFLVTTAYVRDSAAGQSRRPVTFLFNGGPGASSSPLHFDGLAPRIGRGGRAENNPYSILDVTDLVFIDPVGTGFSRPYSEDIGRQFYWNDRGDAASINEVITRWVREYKRTDAPRYMIGESYGTIRIANVLTNHPETRFDGVVLIGAPATNGGSENLLPSMAVAALYHEAIPARGRTPQQLWSEALAFATGEYAAALAKGDMLPDAEKQQVAEKLSALTGLPVSFIHERKLRLSAQDWLMNVLKDKGLRVSNQDTRRTGPLVLDSATASKMSPAEGLGGSAPIGLPGSRGLVPALTPGSDTARFAAGQIATRRMSALETYFRNELQFKTIEEYRSLNLDINPSWRSATNAAIPSISPAMGVANRMRTDQNFRMFWIQGLYDLTTPAYLAIVSYEQAGIPSSRYTGMLAPGPHTVFATDESKQLLSDALRRWLMALQ